jgi:hypothetical protein
MEEVADRDLRGSLMRGLAHNPKLGAVQPTVLLWIMGILSDVHQGTQEA